LRTGELLGEMSPSLQAKLLMVLETGEVRRVDVRDRRDLFPRKPWTSLTSYRGRVGEK